ncbi:hypothetical protein FQN49_001192 [Arthroderma sp. PD_2]|nr:hypothetical protein FQN49_001192 [Arthroderma sp. PD_2]
MLDPTSEIASTTATIFPKTPVSSTSHVSDDGTRLSPNGIYLTLREIGWYQKYHWALLVATSPISGTLLHQTRPNSEAKWAYTAQPEDFASSRAMLVALKLGELPDTSPEWMAAVDECVRSASVRGSEPFTCRTWAMAAVYTLADGGFIDLEPCWEKVGMVEEEAKALVAGATSLDTKIVVSSKYL